MYACSSNPGLGLRLAQGLWGVSSAVLDVALSAEEMKQGRGIKSSAGKSLAAVVKELTSWGFGEKDSKNKFRGRMTSIHACQDILRMRDGYEEWDRRGQTVDTLFDAFDKEYQNLLKFQRHEDADLDMVKNFALLLSRWSGAEIMAEHQRRDEERHPLRRY